jgi:hypothetical protein
MGMTSRLMKSFTVAAFSIFSLFISLPSFAQGEHGEKGGEKKKSFNAQEVIFGHILDGHDFHFLDIDHADGTKTVIGIPLPVILYSPQRGLDVFMSSNLSMATRHIKDIEFLKNIISMSWDRKGLILKKKVYLQEKLFQLTRMVTGINQ